MIKILLNPILLFTTLLFSCSEKPNLDGFNSEVWKKDKYGCEGKREYMAEKLFEQSSRLKGMDDDDLIDLFGKPEFYDWESRGKKSFLYYIRPGSQCDSGMMLEGAKIVFEFDALGRVRLVTEKRF
jgi:hypothetical protein